jgi:hypothetical protein
MFFVEAAAAVGCVAELMILWVLDFPFYSDFYSIGKVVSEDFQIIF